MNSVIRVSGLQSDVVFFKGYAEDIQQYIVFLMWVGRGEEASEVDLQNVALIHAEESSRGHCSYSVSVCSNEATCHSVG